MKKIFNLVLGIFISKKSVENIICSHGFIQYTWSAEKKKYEEKRCCFCGKNLKDE